MSRNFFIVIVSCELNTFPVMTEIIKYVLFLKSKFQNRERWKHSFCLYICDNIFKIGVKTVNTDVHCLTETTEDFSTKDQFTFFFKLAHLMYLFYFFSEDQFIVYILLNYLKNTKIALVVAEQKNIIIRCFTYKFTSLTIFNIFWHFKST